MRRVSGILLASVFIGAAEAKPLVTSSEDTHARICLQQNERPARLISACDAALAEASITHAQRVELLISRSDGYLWLDSFERAIESYREAIELDPKAVDAWNGLGWALWEANGPAEAYTAFDTSLDFDISVQGLGGKAATGRRSGQLTETHAREMLVAALAIDPDYVWAERELGWSFLDDGHPSLARRHFEIALEADPNDTNALYGLGRVELALDDPQSSLERFEEVLALAPEDFPARVYRVIALRRLDRNAHALREADRIIESFPTMSSGYIERGQALLSLGRRKEAIETYAGADKALGPNNAILYWYADALSIDGRFKEALAVIDRGISLDGVDYSDHLLKSYIALELENYPLAKAAAEASLATGIEDPWAHYYVAISLIHDGDIKAGLDRFDIAISRGLPADRVGAFVSELIGAGRYIEATALRLKY